MHIVSTNMQKDGKDAPLSSIGNSHESAADNASNESNFAHGGRRLPVLASNKGEIIILPPPKDQSKWIYTATEVIYYAIYYDDKTGVIKALHEAKDFGPRSATLRSMFPNKKSKLSEGLILKLMIMAGPMGSVEWLDFARKISKFAKHGRPLEEVYSICKYSIENQESDDMSPIRDYPRVVRCAKSSPMQPTRTVTPQNAPRVDTSCLAAKVRDISCSSEEESAPSSNHETAPSRSAQDTSSKVPTISPMSVSSGSASCNFDVDCNTSKGGLGLPRKPPGRTVTPREKHTSFFMETDMSDLFDDEQVEDVVEKVIELTNHLPEECQERIAHNIIGNLNPKTKNHNIIQLKSKIGPNNRQTSMTLCRVPEPRSLGSNTTKESRKKYIARKKKVVGDVLNEILPERLDQDGQLRRQLLHEVGLDHGLFVADAEDIQLSVPELMTLREESRMGSNQMRDFKANLEALKPILKGILLPSCIKEVMAKFEKLEPLEICSTSHHLVTSQKENRRGQCVYWRLLKPGELYERMADSSMKSEEYEESQGWGKLNSKMICTDNIDKGGEMTSLTAKLLNRRKSNSMNHTYSLACVENGAAECYENESETFFNSSLENNPIPRFLQNLDDARYHMITVYSPGMKVCKNMMFQGPVLSQDGQPERRKFEIELLPESIYDTHDSFVTTASPLPPAIISVSSTRSSEGQGPWDKQIDTIQLRLVRSSDDDRHLVGLQLVVSGIPLHSERFRSSVVLEESSLACIRVRVQQIIGIQSNDRKQRFIQRGLKNNACKYGCDICVCPRNHFHHIPTKLHEFGKSLGLFGDDKEHQTYPLREGEYSYDKCYETYIDRTFGMKETAEAEKETNELTKSVVRRQLIKVDPSLMYSEALHQICGNINHFFDEIRKRLTRYDSLSPFILGMKESLTEVETRLEVIATTVRKNSQVSNIVSQIHKQSLKLRRELKAHQAQLRSMEKRRVDLEEDSEFDEARFDEIILRLRVKVTEKAAEIKSHSESSGYRHYVEEYLGLTVYQDAVTHFFSLSCKKPKGSFVHLFNNSVEMFGGTYSPQDSGFHLTGNKLLNALENFDTIIGVLLNAINLSDARSQGLEADLIKYIEVGKSLYICGRAMKSQERQNPLEFSEKVLRFHAHWDDAFPETPYWNKMHDNLHSGDFVENFEFYGRASAESHESSNVGRNMTNGRVKKMKSTSQRIQTVTARSTLGLREEMVEPKQKCAESRKGKARGPYDVDSKTRRDDSLSIVPFHEGHVTFEGNEYFIIPGGGRIRSELKDFFMLAKMGRVPADWNTTIDTHLSAARAAHARHTTY